MSYSSEPGAVSNAVDSGIYSSDTPQFWHHRMHVISITFTVFKLEKSLKHCNHAFLAILLTLT